MTANLLLILIAPNVSEQMGGQAIKALQSFQELKKLGFEPPRGSSEARARPEGPQALRVHLDLPGG